jgi:hypothetical protein
MPDFLAAFEWGAKSFRDVLRGVGAVTCAVINSPFEAEAARRAAAYSAWEGEWEVLPGTDEEEEVLSPCHCSSVGGECIWCEDKPADGSEGTSLAEGLRQFAAGESVSSDWLFIGDTCCCDAPNTLQPCGPCRYDEHADCASTQSPAQPVAASGAVEGPRRGCPPSPSGVPTNLPKLPWAVADGRDDWLLKGAFPGLVCDAWGVVIGRFDTIQQAEAVVAAVNSRFHEALPEAQ